MELREVLWKASRVLGLLLTGAVIALLLWLHLFGEATVGVDAPWSSGAKPAVWICDTAPPWTRVAVPKAIEFWRRHGHELEDAKSSACGHLCPMGDGRMAPCETGGITIDLRDGGFADGHADESFSGRSGDVRIWATVLVPSQISSEEHALPIDIEELVAAHMLGHALGYEHTTTKIAGPFSSKKTGEVMNPRLEDLGWGDEGLPKGAP